MQWVCEHAPGATTDREVTDAIFAACPGSEQFVPLARNDGWDILDGQRSDCDGLARLMAEACNLLGVVAEARFICGSSDSDCLIWETQNVPIEGHNTQIWLLLMQPNPAHPNAPFPNAYQGVCFADNKYYSLAPRKSADTALDMLGLLHPAPFIEQRWVAADGIPSIAPGTPTAFDTVPFPFLLT